MAARWIFEDWKGKTAERRSAVPKTASRRVHSNLRANFREHAPELLVLAVVALALIASGLMR